MEYREKYIELRDEFISIMRENPAIRALWRGDNGKKYNYFITEPEFMEIIVNTIYNKYGNSNVKFLDLGAGVGLMFQMFPDYMNVICTGYEIEDLLMELSKTMPIILNSSTPHSVVKKDMITLLVQDVIDYDIIHFYEPLLNQNDCDNFAQNLYNITNNNQLILYHNGGDNMKSPLETYFNFQDLFLNELFILTRK